MASRYARRVPEAHRALTFRLPCRQAKHWPVIGPSAAGKSSLARLLTGVWRTLRPARCAWMVPTSPIGHAKHLGPMDRLCAAGRGTLRRHGRRKYCAAWRRSIQKSSSQQQSAPSRTRLILNLPQGYDTPVGEGGGCLSPGQRQRIALARALYRNPRLVLLDEPNANLDGAGELALAHAIRGLRKDGVTTIVITHRPSLIAHVDKILLLEGGRVAQFGPVAQVMKALQRKSQAMVDENKITDEPKMAATA